MKNDKNSQNFIEVLQNNDLIAVQKVPKAEAHNHGALGGNIEYIRDRFGIHLKSNNKKFKDILSMEEFIKKEGLIQGVLTLDKNIEAAFVQAKIDGIILLEMSFGSQLAQFFPGGVDEFIIPLRFLHESFAPNIIFRPGVSLNRVMPIEKLYKEAAPFIESGYFTSS